MTTDEVKIGSIYVDSGTVWVGDPCYVLGQDASHGVNEVGDLFAKIQDSEHDQDGHSAPLGKGIGIASTTGWGDGEYPVYARKVGNRIAELRIVFITDEEE